MLELSHFFKPKTCSYRSCNVLITYEYRKKNNNCHFKYSTPRVLDLYNKQDYCSSTCGNRERSLVQQDISLKEFREANRVCLSCKKTIVPIFRRGTFDRHASNEVKYCDDVCRYFGESINRSLGCTFAEKLDYINLFRKNQNEFELFRFVHTRVQRAYRANERRGKNKREFNIDTKYCFEIFPRDYICPVFGIKMNLSGGIGMKHDKNVASLDRTYSNEGYIQENVEWLSWGANWKKKELNLQDVKKLHEYLFKKQEYNPNLNA